MSLIVDELGRGQVTRASVLDGRDDDRFIADDRFRKHNLFDLFPADGPPYRGAEASTSYLSEITVAPSTAVRTGHGLDTAAQRRQPIILVLKTRTFLYQIGEFRKKKVRRNK